MEEHTQKHPGHRTGIGDPFPLHGGKDAFQGEPFHKDDAGPDIEWRQHVGRRPEGMEEGDHRQSPFPRCAVELLLEEHRLGHEIGMGQDRPQRPARETRGVNHDRRVVGIDHRHLPRPGVIVEDAGEGTVRIHASGGQQVFAEG